jgi:IS5 family transposase
MEVPVKKRMITVKPLIIINKQNHWRCKMRTKRICQMSIYEIPSTHEIAQELGKISGWMDAHLELLNWAEADIQRKNLKDTGRTGMTIESILRSGFLLRYWQWTYDDLAFNLMDSEINRGFARLPRSLYPKASALQGVISLIRAETWERINQLLVRDALDTKLESAKMVRIDSTVTDSPIHAPWDSSLLGDAVRVMDRMMKDAQERCPELSYTCHQRVVKKQVMAIRNCKGVEARLKHYKKLIKYTRKTLGIVKFIMQTQGEWKDWVAKAAHYVPLIERIIAQAERRAVKDESVPAAEKVVSLFEEHTDIIVKDKRQVQYGHKINFTSGKHGMILDAVIESGNPADSSRLLSMIKRVDEVYGKLPSQAAADAGYASKENIDAAKALGIKAVGLPKKRGMTVEAMTGSEWIYKKLKRFRAGIEGNISTLKRAFGLDRCTWKGLVHFKAYVMSSVLAYNLQKFARLSI